jgi:hypothetical protein
VRISTAIQRDQVTAGEQEAERLSQVLVTAQAAAAACQQAVQQAQQDMDALQGAGQVRAGIGVTTSIKWAL